MLEAYLDYAGSLSRARVLSYLGHVCGATLFLALEKLEEHVYASRFANLCANLCPKH